MNRQRKARLAPWRMQANSECPSGACNECMRRSAPIAFAGQFVSWLAAERGVSLSGDLDAIHSRARVLAEARRAGLDRWNIAPETLHTFLSSVDLRVLTPGSAAGESVAMSSPRIDRRRTPWAPSQTL